MGGKFIVSQLRDVGVQKSTAIANALLISPDGVDLSSSCLDDTGYSAAPVPSAEHFDSKLRARISRLLAGKRCWVVVLEDIWGLPQAVTFVVGESQVLEFDKVYAGFPCVLFSEDLRQVVLCTKLGYLIFAGARDFVEAAVGGSIQHANQEFSTFAEGWSDPELGSHLAMIKNKYFGIAPTALAPRA